MFIKCDRFAAPTPSGRRVNLSLVFFVFTARIKSREFLVTTLSVPSMVECQGASNSR